MPNPITEVGALVIIWHSFCYSVAVSSICIVNVYLGLTLVVFYFAK